MNLLRSSFIILVVCCLLQSCASPAKNEEHKRDIWTNKTADDWYKKQGWLVGANFIPSNAINQLEMWQAETFDTATIDKELALAEGLGMNTVRVFLHDLLYAQDSAGFISRINTFLEITNRHKIKPLFVFFDSCWDPFPKLGKQREPKPFVHNSGWVQSPGYDALKDSMQYPRLEKYVKGIVGRYANDNRILGWDIWNEPDNPTGPSYGKVDLPNKVHFVLPLLKKAFEWAREADPSQPLTSGIWVGNWTAQDSMKPIEKLQIEESDVVSFHNYDDPATFEQKIIQLQRYSKPLLCTEYMARPNGSTFKGFLPTAKKYNVAMYNWGFVNGKTQTIYPWDSWIKKYTAEPPEWFHDIFQKDGTPYRTQETDTIKMLTGKM